MGKRKTKRPEPRVIGWREWITLPKLGIHAIKPKIDTGARTSSLHARNLITFKHGGKLIAKFNVHPIQRSTELVVSCRCEVLEYRKVRSSNGQLSVRPVIITTAELMGQKWPVEITLANRDEMGFRMLLGREAVRRRFLVDTGRSYLGGKPPEAAFHPDEPKPTRKKRKE